MTRHIFQNVTVNDIKGVTQTAKRWTDNVASTYHSTKIAVLVSVDLANKLNANVYQRPEPEDIWIDLAQETFSYGYGHGFDQTGYELFKESVSGVGNDVYNNCGTLSKICSELKIEYFENVLDVDRRKDL